jgi:hypothetical protein
VCYKELVDDEEQLHQYLRMSKYQFNDLLSRIEPLITKKNTTFQHVTVTDKEKNILSDNVCRRLMAARCDDDKEVRTLYTLNNVTAASLPPS